MHRRIQFTFKTKPWILHHLEALKEAQALCLVFLKAYNSGTRDTFYV